jgi:hypothetical protein
MRLPSLQEGSSLQLSLLENQHEPIRLTTKPNGNGGTAYKGQRKLPRGTSAIVENAHKQTRLFTFGFVMFFGGWAVQTPGGYFVQARIQPNLTYVDGYNHRTSPLFVDDDPTWDLVLDSFGYWMKLCGLFVMMIADIDMNQFLRRNQGLLATSIVVFVFHNAVWANTAPQPMRQAHWLAILPYLYLFWNRKAVLDRWPNHYWFSDLLITSLLIYEMVISLVIDPNRVGPHTSSKVLVVAVGILCCALVPLSFFWSKRRGDNHTIRWVNSAACSHSRFK